MRANDHLTHSKQSGSIRYICSSPSQTTSPQYYRFRGCEQKSQQHTQSIQFLLSIVLSLPPLLSYIWPVKNYTKYRPLPVPRYWRSVPPIDIRYKICAPKPPVYKVPASTRITNKVSPATSGNERTNWPKITPVYDKPPKPMLTKVWRAKVRSRNDTRQKRRKSNNPQQKSQTTEQKKKAATIRIIMH